MKKVLVLIFLLMACTIQAWEEVDLGEGLFIADATVGDGLLYMDFFFIVENRSEVDFYEVIIEVTFKSPNNEIATSFICKIHDFKADSIELYELGYLPRQTFFEIFFSETAEDWKNISFKLFCWKSDN